jgi:hypothetical protein
MLKTDDQERTGQDGSKLQWSNQTRGQMGKGYVNGKKARACMVHVCVSVGVGGHFGSNGLKKIISLPSTLQIVHITLNYFVFY